MVGVVGRVGGEFVDEPRENPGRVTLVHVERVKGAQRLIRTGALDGAYDEIDECRNLDGVRG